MALVRVYLSSVRAFDRCYALSRACFDGLWLGLLGVEAFHEIDRIYYDRNRNTYCDRAWNTRGLTGWEKHAVSEYFGGCETLLVGSVGGGRELQALTKLGFAVDAFECNPALLAHARELAESEGIAATLELAPRDHCPDFGRVYDGAIVGWGGYMLIQERARRVAFLKELRPQVRDGGPLLISFYTRSPGERVYRVIAAVGNAVRAVLGRERLQVGDALAPNYVHYFTEADIRSELTEAGFALAFYSDEGYGRAIGIATAPTGAPVGDGSSREPVTSRV